MYVCGPTVYDVPHLGHGRSSLVFDVLRRYLVWSGLDVRYVSNVTDIDDKIIARAATDGRTEGAVAEQYEGAWWEAMDALGVLRPTLVPHATAYVPDMVALVDDLVGRGVAYETSDGVYLEVDRVDGYGLLAGQSLDSLRAGARVEVSEEKRSPLDFALWKRARPGEPAWDAPFGPGRPGWHTECVVMSLDLLGDGFDLHGGGLDLQFPHHENERAQAVAEGRSFARHWVHHGFVTMGAEKMSKSLGNVVDLLELVRTHDPRAYRLLVLQASYRSPMEVTPDTLAQAEETLARLDALARRFGLDDLLADGAALVAGRGPAVDLDADALSAFNAAMDDDLDTVGALSDLFDLVRRANAAADAEDPGAPSLARTAAVLFGALGLALRAGEEPVDPEAARLVAERDGARAARDWPRADALRDQLTALGWVVEDGPHGTVLHR
jgi:cysteinyl-tRNA synthetase